jgi:hypothetical protein
MAHKDEKGYGRFRYSPERRGMQAHRVSLILTCGYEIPGAHVLHSNSCHSRGCVEPTHLRWGTNAENMADRMVRGGYLENKKLTREQVAEIKSLLRRGGRSRSSIAREYGVCHETVDRIFHGTAWRYVE